LARLVGGPAAVRTMTTQRGASNARIKQELGWEPRYPDWRAGFPTLGR
jgi:nucleoside-diphosphate-sugar epimerase